MAGRIKSMKFAGHCHAIYAAVELLKSRQNTRSKDAKTKDRTTLQRSLQGSSRFLLEGTLATLCSCAAAGKSHAQTTKLKSTYF